MADRFSVSVGDNRYIMLLAECCEFDVFSDLHVFNSEHAALIVPLKDKRYTLVAYGSIMEEMSYLRTMFRLANQYTAVGKATLNE